MHHVMNRGAARQPIFGDDADRLELGHRLVTIHDEYAVDVLAYCLMGNHFHLLLHAPPGVLSEAMQHLSSVYTRRFNRRHDRDGPLFRARFLSIPVETEEYLLWVVRYIHRNPLDLPGIDRPGDYRWSSYRAYLGLRPAPAFLDVAPAMDLLGGNVSRLVALTEDVGTDKGSPDRRLFSHLGVDDVWALADLAVATDDIELGRWSGCERSRRAVARLLVLLVARRCPDPVLAEELLDSTGHLSSAARRSAASRAEKRLRSDPSIDRMLMWIHIQIGFAPPKVLHQVSDT